MAVESAALRPEQFWVVGSIAGALQTAHAVCCANLGRFLDLHASVFVDAEIDRVAKDHNEDHRHGGEFDRRRSAIVPDEAETRFERWRSHDFRQSLQVSHADICLHGARKRCRRPVEARRLSRGAQGSFFPSPCNACASQVEASFSASPPFPTSTRSSSSSSMRREVPPSGSGGRMCAK